jgi:AAA domain
MSAPDPGFEARMAGYKKSGEESQRRFTLVPFKEIRFDRRSPYLVAGLLPREGVVVIYGPPKSAKTFWVFDLLMSVGRGIEYRGWRTKRGRVVYVATEGERGLAARVEAYRRKFMPNGEQAPEFYLVGTRLDLAADAATLLEDIRAQIGTPDPAIICVDTLNRSISGSESSDEDMGAYIKACDLIQQAFRCLVILIHHCGIDRTRPRGHTSLQGAADCVIAVKRSLDGLVDVEIEAMKDGEAGRHILSRLEVVNLGEDEDGEMITSCVVWSVDEPLDKKTADKPLSGTAKAAFNMLTDCIAREGELAPVSNHIPNGARGCHILLWRAYLEAGGIVNPKGNPREQLKRIVVTLKNAGAIGVWEDFVWLVTSVTSHPLSSL